MAKTIFTGEMKPAFLIALLIALCASLTSCNRVSPRKVVGRAVLNSNTVTVKFSPKFFDELRERKSKGRIVVFEDNRAQPGTAEEYVEQMVIAPANDAMESVEKLPKNEDTGDLVEASLEMFRYATEIFEEDYRAIARMIDGDQPQQAIDAAIQQLFETHDPELGKRVKRLDELAIPYAEKHDIPLQVKR